MAIPDYQTLMLPLLKFTSDGALHTTPEAVDVLASEFSLTPEDLAQMLPSGNMTTFKNRVGWARSYMKQAGLIDSPVRGKFKVTPEGLSLLAERPEHIDNKLLERYDSFLEFRARGRTKTDADIQNAHTEPDSVETPEEQLESSYEKLKSDLESEVLGALKSNSPGFFERVVLDVLLRMGYGGNRHDAAKAVGKAGDGGIDGTINEDRLGLDVIYVQAKRWEGSVGRPEIQKFAGALQGRRATKGVFITTSSFTKEAHEYSAGIMSRIILIDGERLARLMVDFGVGVSTVASFEIKRIDTDYFDES